VAGVTGAGAAQRRILFIAANTSIDRLHEVDHLTPGAIHRPTLVIAVPGGKGLNAARVAAVLGADVAVAAIVGGRAGEWIADRLAALGVRASLVRTAAETRTCLSVLDRAEGSLTEFYEPGEPIESRVWAELETAIAREIAGGDLAAIAMSGSLPPAAPVDGYARIVGMAAEAGVPAIVDAHGEALDHAVAAGPTVVKVNATEAGARSSGAPDVLEAARAMRARGASAVVVTLGPDGAIVVDDSGSWRLTGPPARGAYPVGSGDAFLAGFATALGTEVGLVEAARGGIAVGFANAQTAGAGELDPVVARHALSEVVVEPIGHS
jgi:tagatose 6-phosphate kinase